MVAPPPASVKAIPSWYTGVAMKKASWILAIVFGLAFIGATLMNATLVGRARAALASAYLGAPKSAGVATAQARLESERYHIVLLLPDTGDSFFNGLLDGATKAAGPMGAAVQVFRYPGADSGEAGRYFEIALRAKVDGLIMYAPRDSHGATLAELAAEASRNGVVFIPVGMDAPLGENGPFIGSGSLMQGIEGGKVIGSLLGASARVGVVISAADSGGRADDPLSCGVRSTLATFPGARVVAVAMAQPGILSGEAVIESMLRSNPSINAVLCSSARDTIGAAQVIIDFNEVGKVLIIGADETPDIQRYIEKGVIAASVVRDSTWIGEEAVRTFLRLKQGGKIPGPVETGFLVIKTKDGAR